MIINCQTGSNPRNYVAMGGGIALCSQSSYTVASPANSACFDCDCCNCFWNNTFLGNFVADKLGSASSSTSRNMPFGNVVMGWKAQSNTQMLNTCYNVTIGAQAGVSSTSISPGNITDSGSQSVFIGGLAGGGCVTAFNSGRCRAACNSVMIGFSSGKCAIMADRSVFIGYGTGACKFCGDDAVFIGHGSGQLGVHDSQQDGITAIGYNSYYQGKYGARSVLIGTYQFYTACLSNFHDNVMVGYESACCFMRGCGNVGLGTEVFGGARNGSNACFNVAIGKFGAAYLSACLYSCNQSSLQSRYNVAVGSYGAAFCSHSGQVWVHGECNTVLGSFTSICNGSCNTIIMGTCACGGGNNCTIIGSVCHPSGACFYGCVIKGSGSFTINHPDPKLNKTKTLSHSFVESPNAGDNIYRWSINTKNCSYKLKLPDYFKYLNKDNTVKISPVGHFGRAYGSVSKDGEYLNVCSSIDGKFNILAIGTRCDDLVKRLGFKLEEDMSDFDIQRCAKGCFIGYR